jgi:multiple sugar transport system ATP-binding protein
VPSRGALGARQVPHDGCIGLRPEGLRLVPPTEGEFMGRVDLVEALGAETLVHVSTVRGTSITARQSARTSLSPGDPVGLAVDPARVHVFDAQGRTAAAVQ